MSSLAWLASLTSSAFVLTTLIESISFTKYTFTPLQSTLLMLFFLLLTVIFNTYLASLLPAIEGCSLFGHLAGFILVVVPLLYFAPKNSAKQVLTEVVNNGGWGNRATSCMVSQVAVLFCCIGSDSVVHICKSLFALQSLDILTYCSGRSRRCIPSSPASNVVFLPPQHYNGFLHACHNALLHWRSQHRYQNPSTLYSTIPKHRLVHSRYHAHASDISLNLSRQYLRLGNHLERNMGFLTR